jgi:hypothetical protein
MKIKVAGTAAAGMDGPAILDSRIRSARSKDADVAPKQRAGAKSGAALGSSADCGPLVVWNIGDSLITSCPVDSSTLRSRIKRAGQR